MSDHTADIPFLDKAVGSVNRAVHLVAECRDGNDRQKPAIIDLSHLAGPDSPTGKGIFLARLVWASGQISDVTLLWLILRCLGAEIKELSTICPNMAM